MLSWFSRFTRFFKVCLVGGVGLMVQLLIFNILRHVFAPVSANVLAVECAIVSNFILNNRYSFSDRKLRVSRKKLLLKFMQFNLLSLGSVVIQTLVVFIGTAYFGRGLLLENALVLIGIALGIIYNYSVYTRYVWKLES